MTVRLIIRGEPVQIDETEFYSPWKTIDVFVTDDVLDVEKDHIVGATILTEEDYKVYF